MSSIYQYEPLGTESGQQEIRLINLLPGHDESTIRCRISHTSLSSAPTYEALSYCWGAEKPQHLITIIDISGNLSKLFIRENLYHALNHLRKVDEETIFWIDAICIDQSDIPERNNQVSIMREIYEKASRTVIWLGEEAENSADALLLMKELNEAKNLDETEGIRRDLWKLGGDRRGLPASTARIWRDLFQIPQRPWFRRVWIVQELAASPQALVMCGDSAIPWREMVRAFEFVVQSEGFGLVLGLKGLSQLVSLDMTRRSYQENVQHDPLYVLMENRKGSATDPKDHVFAFHGFFQSGTLGQRITTPRYEDSTIEVYCKVAHLFLENRHNLDILSITRLHEKSRDKTLQHLPTWVPDWTCGDLPASFLWNSICPDFPLKQRGMYRASGDSKYVPSPDSFSTPLLRTEGWIIDEIAEVSELLEPREDHMISYNIWKFASEFIRNQRVLFDFEQVAVARNNLVEYPTGESLLDAYWKTLLGGITYGDPNGMKALFWDWYQGVLPFRILQLFHLDRVWFLTLYLFFRGLWRTIFWVLSLSNPLDSKPMKSPFLQFATLTSHRRMMRSSLGLVGLAPPRAKAGDKVVLAKGGKLPLVLRQRGGAWEFIGDSYMHAVMDGKLWDILEEEKIECSEAFWHLCKQKSTRQEFWLV